MRAPCVIATWIFGKPAVDRTGALLAEGTPILDAVEKGINQVEENPAVDSVGYGGKPNAEGIVELDAAIMDGRHLQAGAVAALKGFRRPISIARRVMEKSPHAMLAGEGAAAFALSEGFQREETLTPRALKKYHARCEKGTGASEIPHDTLGLLALDAQGQLAAGCTTSGLAFKHPGRVGDSPIIGSGLYADNDIGAATATGDGDVILRLCLSFLVVERMRTGASPGEACAEAVRRYLGNGAVIDGRDVNVLALNSEGETGAATLRAVFPYAVWRPGGSEMKTAVRLNG